MTLNKENQTFTINGNTFKYTINEAFSAGSSKCLTVSRINEGIDKLPLNSPIVKQVLRSVKENDFFKSEVDVDFLMILNHKEFIRKNDSFIMSDLAKI